MTREELVRDTRQLIAEGERLVANPSKAALRVWLQLTDDLLARAWGSMDRYHLAWLQVGRPAATIRGREMTARVGYLGGWSLTLSLLDGETATEQQTRQRDGT